MSSTSSLAALRPAWEALAARVATASPFNTWVWVTTWWRMFGAGKELRLFIGRVGDEIVAIAPFYTVIVSLGPRRLRLLLPLGFGNDLTERMEMLVAPQDRAEALSALSTYLASQRQEMWDIMIWTTVRASEMPPALQRLVRADDPRPFALAELPSSWEDFVAGLNKSMRDNLKYYPRLLARHGHEVGIRVVAAPDEISPAINEFFRLHRLRARARSLPHHDDRFGTPTHRRFLTDIAPILAGAGQLRVGYVTVDGVQVAAQLTLEHGDVLYMYYSGFDPAWQSYSVGMLATAACIQDAIERGMRHVDFLQGTGQFKRRWGTRDEPVSRLVLVRDSLSARLCFVAYTGLQLYAVRWGRLQSRHGVGPRLRVLRRLLALLGQAAISV